MKQTKQVKKEFECKPSCKKIHIGMIITSCDKCIRHVSYVPTKEENKKILAILTKQYV